MFFFYKTNIFCYFSRFSKLQELADARVNKDGMENVKLKLANENRVVGVQLMLRNLGDELTSDKTLLRINSKNNNEKFASSLLIIPGIEGVGSIQWKNLGLSLNLPAFVLQLTNIAECKTVEQMSNAIMGPIRSTVFDKKEFFYLVGYSYGSFITLEIARVLEEAGMNGHILLIDGAPNFLRQLSYGTLGSTQMPSDAAIQGMLIHAIANQILAEQHPDEIVPTILELKTWPEKINKLIEYGRKAKIDYSDEYLRKMVRALFVRLKSVFEFDESTVKKIKSSITLVRPTEVAVVDIDEHYELSKYTEGFINLKFVEGNHTTMLDNEKLAQIINDADPNLASDRDFKAYVWSGKNT